MLCASVGIACPWVSAEQANVLGQRGEICTLPRIRPLKTLPTNIALTHTDRSSTARGADTIERPGSRVEQCDRMTRRAISSAIVRVDAAHSLPKGQAERESKRE